MFEWLAILVAFVILRQLRSRVAQLEERSAAQQATIAGLTMRITPTSAAATGRAPEPRPEPARPRPAHDALVLPPHLADSLRMPPTFVRPNVPPPTPPAPAIPRPVAASERATAGTPPPVPPAALPPRPPAPPRAPEPPEPPFDWEKLIGVKLFSWIAGAALALAAVFFLRYSMDHGWLRPEIRMAIGLIVGALLLIVCELKAARDYPQTANAMDAAGIAILFATVFASHALWHLVPPTAAFGMLALVTAVAVLLSIRRESMFIALLGLLGGFSTPVLLSSGQDNPIGLFGYLLLLNAGLAWVAYRKRWPLLTALSMVFSTLYQWGWVAKFLTVDKLPIAVGVFLLFPIFSVIALALGNRGYAADYADGDASPAFAHSLFARTARVSAALPLLFSLYLATVPAYGAHFGILFGFLFCLSVGLFAVSVLQGPAWLHALGALSTVATFAIWFQTSYVAAAWPWMLGIVSAFVITYLTAPIVARALRDVELEGSAMFPVFAAPLLLFAFPLLLAIEPRAGAPALTFGVLFGLLAACAAFAIVARLGTVHYVAAFFALAAEAVWSSRYLDAAHLYSGLALYAAFGLLYVGAPLVARRFKRPFQPAGAAGALTLASLALLLFVASGSAAASALWGMALLIAVLNVGLFLESSSDRMPLLSIAGTALSWVVLAVWWRTANASAIVPALVVMAGFAVLTMGGSAWARHRAGDGEVARGFDANVFMGLVGHVFVVFVVTRPELSIPPWPVFGALAVLDLAVLAAALYMRDGAVHLAAIALTAVIFMMWTFVAREAPWPQVAVLAASASVALAYLALPLARRVGARGRAFDLAPGAAVVLAQLVLLCAQSQPGAPSLSFLLGAQVVLVGAALSLSWIDAEALGWAAAAAVVPAAISGAQWQLVHPYAADWRSQLLLTAPIYLLYVVFPLLLGRRAGQARAPYVAAVLANVPFFFLARHSLTLGGYAGYIGALPVVQALLLVPTLALLVRLERERAASARDGAALASGRLALVAAATLACITVAIPLQLEKNWITIGWAIEGAALLWLFRRIPHTGLMAAAIALLATAFARLALNPAVLTYHARGAMPIFNWYLYTYLLCAAALFLAARFTADGDEKARRLSGLFAGGGAVLLFLLLNIEIADYYATGPTITFNFNANLAQDLTYTIGWAAFALGLLAAGILLENRQSRIASIVLLTATVAKCFLHDLGRLGGLYRVGSFVGLALCLALVAIVLQKFVLARDSQQLSQA
jgi:uncharacterized membrane protein